MSTQKSIVDYIVDQAAGAGSVRARAMFGEYGVYCDDKIVALVCDDGLYVKPTDAGRAFAGEIGEGAPYPGAKPHMKVPETFWDDPDWLSGLFRVTAEALPQPKPKRRKTPKS